MTDKRTQHRPLSGTTVFVTAIVVSMLAHTTLGWWLWDKSIVSVQPGQLAQDRELFRVFRAERDLVVGDDPSDLTTDAADRELPTLAQMSRALLEAGTPPRAIEDSAPPAVRVRDLPGDEPPRMAAASESLQLPDLKLPAGVLRDLPPSAAPAAMAFVPDPATGSGAGSGSGLGSADAARTLAGTGLSAGLSEPSRFTMTESGPIDQRRMDAPLDAPPIDFIDLALHATTQLEMPQHLDDDFDYYVKTWNDRDGFSYFQVDIVARRSLTKLRTMPKDVVFLVDISGSIPQLIVNEIVAGLSDALGAFNEGDRFNIVLFRDTARFFSTDGIRDATPDNVEAARAFLADARAGGSTDINRALSLLLTRDFDKPRVYNIVLISDGHPTKGIQDTRQLINLITRDNEMTASIYSVGVTRAPNVELLEFIAYRNKGFCVIANRLDQVAPTIRDLMSRLRYPIIRDVALSVVGLDGEVYPLHLPNIHSGESFSVFGRYQKPEQFMMRITGRNADRAVDFTFSRDLAASPRGDAAVRQGWAFWKLHHLYSEMIRRGEARELLAEIDQLRRQYRLKTLY
jgi:hypothetical protein